MLSSCNPFHLEAVNRKEPRQVDRSPSGDGADDRIMHPMQDLVRRLGADRHGWRDGEFSLVEIRKTETESPGSLLARSRARDLDPILGPQAVHRKDWFPQTVANSE